MPGKSKSQGQAADVGSDMMTTSTMVIALKHAEFVLKTRESTVQFP